MLDTESDYTTPRDSVAVKHTEQQCWVSYLENVSTLFTYYYYSI